MPELSPEVLENETTPARRRWPVVVAIVAATVAVVAAGVWFMVIEPRLARKDFDRAVADWKAAGLGDPLVAPVAPPLVPDSRNLLKQPPFDGWGTMLGAPGGREALWEEVGSLIFVKSGVVGEDFGFDPDAQLSLKPAYINTRLPLKKAAGVPATRVFIEALEAKFPELVRAESVAKEFPEMWIPPANWARSFSDMPMISYKAVRSNSYALTAYTGCKMLEGDGSPAAFTVPLILRYGDLLGGRGTPVDTMVAVISSRSSVPRLVHTGLAQGVWSDAQLRDLLRASANARYTEFVRDAFCNECAYLARVFEGAARGEAACLKIFARYTTSGVSIASRPAGLLRQATILLDESRKVLVCFDKKTGFDATGGVSVQNALVAKGLTSGYEIPVITCASFSKCEGNAARLDIDLDACALGCALELWRRGHGAYPEKLDDLTPGLLSAAPPERVRGVRPVYARTATGYELRWTGGNVYEGLVSARMESSHPGPWNILGYDLELPKDWTMFDSHKFSKGTLKPTDIVWTMAPPPVAK